VKVSTVSLVVALAACSGAAPPAPAALPPPRTPEAPPLTELEPHRPTPRARPERDPRDGLLVPGRPMGRRDDLIVRERERGPSLRLDPSGPVAESQFWDRCVREFVAAQPEAVRRVLTTAFTRCATQCDPAGRIVLQLTRGSDGRDRRGASDVGFSGSLSAKRIDLSLRLAYCGQPPPIADHVVLTADDMRWTSPRLDFERDEHGCEVVELPTTRSLLRALRAVVDAPDGAVHLEGKRGEDLEVTDDMKQDLRVMLDALEALQQP
jgi:hypothetical protein